MSARLLPLFPLPLVLMPGVPLPLHVFEPRYRQLLADVLAGDRTFGIVFRPDDVEERALPAGHVGCLARVEETQPLPDGRSNILVRGGERFALVRLVEAAHPYHVAEVEGYADEPEADGPLAEVAGRVRETFARLDRAARAIADDRATGAVLPDDPGALSFAIASMIDLDAAQRQRMLVSRSPSGRLQELAQLLARAVGPLERRAVVHQRAKSNGHGPSSHA